MVKNPGFNCFILDDEKPMRRLIERLLATAGINDVYKFANPQQMAEAIDLLHQQMPDSLKRPTLVFTDGDMTNANYDSTCDHIPNGTDFDPSYHGSFEALKQKHQEGKIGDFITAVVSLDVATDNPSSPGPATALEDIHKEKFKPNPQSHDEAILIKKDSDTWAERINAVIDLFRETFSLLEAKQVAVTGDVEAKV